MGALLDLDPDVFARELAAHGGRATLYWDDAKGGMVACESWLDPLAAWMNADTRDVHWHEAVFLATGTETGALMGAYGQATLRGQAAGRLRLRPNPRLESVLRDGLRLSLRMSHKSALAGLWWGGVKGIVVRPGGAPIHDPTYRRTLYREYCAF